MMRKQMTEKKKKMQGCLEKNEIKASRNCLYTPSMQPTSEVVFIESMSFNETDVA